MQRYLTLPGPQAEGCGEQKLHPLGQRGHQWDSSFLLNTWPRLALQQPQGCISSMFIQLTLHKHLCSRGSWHAMFYTHVHTMCDHSGTSHPLAPQRAEKLRVERSPYTKPAPCPTEGRT